MNETAPSPGGTVTLWIEQLKDGDAQAVEKLWGRYFPQLVELARSKLGGTPRAAADEEDVALSAFKSFCLGARRGQFPRLTDRDSLWSLLVGITAHKCVDRIRHENRKKRSVAGHSPAGPLIPSGDEPISRLISEQPTPEFAAAGAKALAARERRGSFSRRLVLASGGILVLLAAGAVGLAVWNPSREPRPKDSRHSPPGNLASRGAAPPAERWALSFNGTTSFVEAASPGLAGEPVTLEAIVTVREPRIAVVFVWFHDEWYVGFGLNLDGRWSLGHCRANTDEKPSYFATRHAHTTEQVPTHQRLHLAAVFHGDERRLFVNGEQRHLETEGAFNTSGGLKRIYVGRSPPLELEPNQTHPDRFFNGLVHAVRISRGVRYTSNFEPPEALGAEPGDDSILAFDFEEGAENVTHDVLGRATAKIIDAEWVQP